MDEIDRAILRMLQEDGRVPLAEMGRFLGMSRTAVRYRIREMERKGLIRGFTVTIDPLSLGSAVFIKILIKVKPYNIADCIKEMNRQKEIVELLRISGAHTLHATAVFRSPQHLNNFLMTKMDRLPIESYEVLNVVQSIKSAPISL